MAVFTGRRTRRQIIDQALKKAGNTKIIVEARIELARILENLYLQHEWPFLYTETTLTLSASTSLPSNFLKTESSDTGLRVTSVDSVTQDSPIQIVTPTEWRRMAIPRDATATTPDIAMVDYGASVIKPWPVPIGLVQALLVYKFLPGEVDPADTVTFDANIPTFPFHGLLTDYVEAWALEYEHNPAAQMLFMKNKDSLSMVLGTAIPRDANQSNAIELDPQFFSTPYYPNG
jgi:hypothetical protein